jgi:hypothetical protein
MPDDAEMKTIIKELIKVMQKLQSQTSSETPNIQGIHNSHTMRARRYLQHIYSNWITISKYVA